MPPQSEPPQSADSALPALGERTLFPDIDALAYLAHAAISPLSLPVRRAIESAAREASTGVVGFQRSLPMRARLRERLARLIGARAENLSFVANTTSGVLDIAFGHPWRAGDRIVLFEGEFPANTTPWLSAARTFDLKPIWVPLAAFERSDDEGIAALDIALAGGAALIAVSAVQFQTGLRMPLRRIAERARSHGARLFVDAIQGLGAVPIDVAQGCDYLSAGAHKWLMGSDGAGLLYVSDDAMQALEPKLVGWLSHEDPLEFLIQGEGYLRYDRPLRRQADLFEQGMLATISLAGLDASTAILESLGVAAIYEHTQRYVDRLESALVERGWSSARAPEADRRSAILSLRPPAGVDLLAVHRGLEARRIRCSLPDGWLRFAPHWPNPLDELSLVIDALDETVDALER